MPPPQLQPPPTDVVVVVVVVVVLLLLYWSELAYVHSLYYYTKAAAACFCCLPVSGSSSRVFLFWANTQRHIYPIRSPGWSSPHGFFSFFLFLFFGSLSPPPLSHSARSLFDCQCREREGEWINVDDINRPLVYRSWYKDKSRWIARLDSFFFFLSSAFIQRMEVVKRNKRNPPPKKKTE